MKLAPTYKVDLNGSIRMHIVEVEGNKYRTESGLLDGARVISEWTECFGKNVGKSNGTTDEEQALKVAQRIRQIRLEQGDYENIEDAGKGKKFFQPMLASKYDAVKSKIVDLKNDTFKTPGYTVFVQKKLDGIRLIASLGTGMQSRTGKQIISAPHIFRKLKPFFEKHPDVIFDGELYTHSMDDNFNEVISMARKTKPTVDDLKLSEEKLQYWIYDLPSCPGNFSERNAELRKIFAENPDIFDDSFVLVETLEVSRPSLVEEKYLEKFVSEGFEGAIVRLDKPYECKRSKNLLKVKQFQDEEFTILDIVEGRGNLSGCAGNVVVDVAGKAVSAGLKFCREDAREIWENREKYIGKLATVKFFNKTQDGSLRFPKCTQIARNEYE